MKRPTDILCFRIFRAVVDQVKQIRIPSKLPTATEMNAITTALNTVVTTVNFAVRIALIVFHFYFLFPFQCLLLLMYTRLTGYKLGN